MPIDRIRECFDEAVEVHYNLLLLLKGFESLTRRDAKILRWEHVCVTGPSSLTLTSPTTSEVQ